MRTYRSRCPQMISDLPFQLACRMFQSLCNSAGTLASGNERIIAIIWHFNFIVAQHQRLVLSLSFWIVYDRTLNEMQIGEKIQFLEWNNKCSIVGSLVSMHQGMTPQSQNEFKWSRVWFDFFMKIHFYFAKNIWIKCTIVVSWLKASNCPWRVLMITDVVCFSSKRSFVGRLFSALVDPTTGLERPVKKIIEISRWKPFQVN